MNDLIPKVDLLNDSITHLLTVSFGKTSSPSYPLAVSVAMGADKYDEIKLGGNTVHMVAFAKNRDGAARAISLLQYISEWKTTQIYGGGKLMQTYYRVSQVLRCYIEATACEDWRAHCQTVIDDPFYESKFSGGFQIMITPIPIGQPPPKRADRYIFPCTLLQPNFHHRTSDHPADPIHQIQAEAISIGCDICPYFNPRGYKKVDQKQKL